MNPGESVAGHYAPEAQWLKEVHGKGAVLASACSGAVLLGDERVRLELLQERVRQKMETVSEKKVYLRGDGTVQLQDLMSVFDRLKDAGVADVGIVAKAPGDK